MKRKIVVNATALDRSGALSILKQFIENIPQDYRNWLIFVSPNVSITTENPNVRIVPIEGVKPMHKRLWWDAVGLKKWLRNHDIEPVGAVSLQNTGFNAGKKIPTYIYYHQSIPFFPFKWNPLKKQERIFWFYKYIYPLFVRMFLKKETKVFVQLDFIKKGFSRRFGHPEDRIKVFTPSVSVPADIDTYRSSLQDTLELLYPATPFFYKNHRIIDSALVHVYKKIHVLFTLGCNSMEFHDNRIRLIGVQPYEKICELYRTCDALIFPSYIETFGLPLLEAAMVGMPIIAADLTYAKEVLAGYEGVKFVKHNDPNAWAEAIEQLEKGKRYKPIDISNRPGWKELFEEILN